MGDLAALTMDEIHNGYFWRLIKIITKFDVNLFKNNVWKIDENTLKIIRNAWEQKFGSDEIKEFVNRLLFWTIDDDLTTQEFAEIINRRLAVFELIEFDDCLKKKFKSLTFRTNFYRMVRNDGKLSYDKKRFINKAFREFLMKKKKRNCMIVRNLQQIEGLEPTKTTKPSDSTEGNQEITKITKNLNKTNRVRKNKNVIHKTKGTSFDLNALPTRKLQKVCGPKKMYKHYRFKDDDNIIKYDYYHNEDNLRLSTLLKKKYKKTKEKKSECLRFNKKRYDDGRKKILRKKNVKKRLKKNKKKLNRNGLNDDLISF